MPLNPSLPTPIPGTSMSAQDIVKSALRLINVVASGENPTGTEAEDGLVVLNQMIDSFNAESLMIFTESIQDFPFTSEKQTYTLGSGGDFDTPRPAKIDRASVILITANPIEIPIPIYNDQRWQQVTLKSVDTTFPLLVYDDGAFPFRNLNFWPIPRDGSSVKFRMYSWSPLSQFPDLTTKLTFPPAYYELIRYSLAVRLAPEFQAVLRPEVGALALSAISKVKAMNSKDDTLVSDLGVGPSSSRIRNELFGIP
jgi:hypothetical protein